MNTGWCFVAIVVGMSMLVGSVPVLAAEAPHTVTEAQVAEAVKSAPPLPQSPQLDLGLKTRLIDFIDCTNPKDPHDFIDQGTSTVADGPAGRYRITAAHRHAFFSYRCRSAGKDQPILIVYEYPDDANRNIGFFTHESGVTGRSNIDWSLETGVYTGDPLPLSNRMQYHTFIWWPQEDWPAVLVANWARNGSNGAASRIWVYAIEGPLPKLAIDAPQAANQRRFGHYNSLGHYLSQRLYFGLKSPKAIEHMLDYCEYIGVNELSWSVVHENADHAMDCTIPSWDAQFQNTQLDETLAAMDARGGFGFVAGLAFMDYFKMGGKVVGEMTPAEARAAIIKGLDEFLDRYGKYKSLKGISLGGMFGIEVVDLLNKNGILQEVVAHIKTKRPDLEVATYLGGRELQGDYFGGDHGGRSSAAPVMWQVISGWENGAAAGKNQAGAGASWSDWLGDQVLACWKAYGRDPAMLKAVKGLTVYEQLQPDDHHILDFYHNQPRSMVYYDVERSQRRSDHVGSAYAAVWNTHYEGWFGLSATVNYWYKKLWLGPDFDAPPPLALAPFANTLALRDRQLIIAGSWNWKYFGHEADIRRFAKAFRSLPPVEMKDAAGPDTVKVRWAVEKGKRYVSVVSRIPFACEVTMDGKKVALPPYELVTLVDDGQAEPKVAGTVCAEYKKWLEGRMASFEKLMAEAAALDAKAVPEAYKMALQEARRLLAEGQLYAADIALGEGLVNELRLRQDLLRRPELLAPKLAAGPEMKGDLNAWPKEASDIRAEGGEFIAGHLYFPNSWSGPADLSARLRLGHDGTNLYVGVEIRDQKLNEEEIEVQPGRKVTRGDSCVIKLCDKGYSDWTAAEVRPTMMWPIEVPIKVAETKGEGAGGFNYTCRRTPTGYVFEGSAPLSGLGLKPGQGIGFLLMVNDNDGTDNLKPTAWAAKQTLLYPHRPNFVFYEDARTGGRLILGQ